MRGQKAFTLVEMLIVIAIIAILAVLAAGAYSGARRSAQIDLAADGLVSALKYQQGLSKSGKVEEPEQDLLGPKNSGRQTSKCYGLYFKKKDQTDAETQVQYVETPYFAVHPNKPLADVCDLTQKELSKYETDADYELFLISRYRPDDDADEVLILFKPPFARVVVGDLDKVAAPGIQISPFITFGISLPGGENKKYFRLDTSTGLIERIYGEQL